MTTVEIVYDHDCPNVSAARAQLMRAFAETRLPPHWTEWARSDPESPDCVRGYGSPTILVGGKDVAGVAPSEGISCCRLYPGTSGEVQGVPSVRMIASALRATGRFEDPAKRPVRSVGWRSSLAALPGIGAALLPVGVCPACWPAYAGVLGALGLGFLLKTAYLMPVTALFLLVAVGALAFRAKSRRGYGPFTIGLVATATVLIGKFIFLSDVAMYGGMVLLAAASIWNAWPQEATGVSGGACPACAPGGRVPHSRQSGAKEVSS